MFPKLLIGPSVIDQIAFTKSVATANARRVLMDMEWCAAHGKVWALDIATEMNRTSDAEIFSPFAKAATACKP